MKVDTRSRRSERGFASVLIVGMSTVLLLFLGISIDWGILLRYRRAMYNACDSGALAGALNLKNDPMTVVEVGERYARNDMTQNNIQWDLRDQNGDGRADGVIATPLDNATDQQATGSPPWKALRVEIQHDVPTYLFRLVRDFVTVRIRCMAKVANVIPDDLNPLGLDYCRWAPNYRPPGEPLATVCTQPPYPPPDPNAPQCANYIDVFPFSARPPGCQSFDISIKDNNDPDWGGGNTGLLRFCDNGDPPQYTCGGGGSQWQDYFCNVYCDTPPPPAPVMSPYCFDPARTDDPVDSSPCAQLNTKPGVTFGQVKKGIQDRCANPDQDAQYLKLLLLNPDFHPAAGGGGGTFIVEIWGFAVFQIDCSDPFAGGSKNIRGGFVNFVSGRQTGRETELDTGAFTIKLAE